MKRAFHALALLAGTAAAQPATCPAQPDLRGGRKCPVAACS